MATGKIGVYRKYRGRVPTGSSGQALPMSEWAGKRPFSWAARWFGLDGKRYSRSFKTRKEAERFAEAKQAEVRQGRGDPPTRCTLRQFYDEHRKLSKGAIRPTTLHMQLAALALLAEQVGWDRDVKRVSSREVEALRAKRSGEVQTPTVNKEIKQLKRLFNLAIARGYLANGANPCHDVQLLKVGEKRPRFCPVDRFATIFEQAPELLWQALLVVFYTTAVRLAEAMHLTWDDIDFDAEELHVARRSAEGFVQAWSPKDHELRTIPVPERALALLRQLKLLAPRDCPYVFMDSGRWDYYRQQVENGDWNDRRLLMNNWLRRFKTMCKQAKAGKLSIHDLRRSCITNWARSGLPIHVAQKFAGHADIKTTQKFYLSVQDEDVKKARRLQQEIVGGLKVTDPKLTHRACKRSFPGRKTFGGMTQLRTEKEVA